MQKTTPAPATGAPTRPARPDGRTGRVAAGPVPEVAPAPALTLTLTQGAMHWIHRPAGRTVVCDHGTLWLRFDCALPGTVLDAGQAHLCAAASALTIMALSSAQARFC